MPAPACCRCQSRRASPLTCLAVCFLVLTYTLLGAVLFLALEGGARDPAASLHDPAALSHDPAASLHDPAALSHDPAGSSHESAAASQHDAAAALRARTVDRLWAITEDLNILYKENWTELAARELVDFQRVLLEGARGGAPAAGAPGAGALDADHHWTFSGSFLYALTLITTIGHGNVTPKSAAGKMVAVAYACVGIPIIMLYLSTIGEALARNFRVLYSRVCPERFRSAGCHPRAECAAEAPGERAPAERRTPFQAALNLEAVPARRRACRAHTRVPPALSLLPLALYVALGSAVFHATERWDLMEGCYFSFSSLATVGFGSLRPGRHARGVSARAEDAALAACCAYILVGIVVVAMCFNLVQEDVRAAARGVAARCAGPGVHAAAGPAAPAADKAALS